MNIGELFIKLGFDVDDNKMRGFDSQLVNVKNNLFGVREYAIAATYAIGQFIGASVTGTADMQGFAEQTGLSVEALQDWQNVASQLNRNLNAGAVTSSIKNLQDKITQIQRFGEGDVLPFNAFGVDVMDTDALKTLEQIRKTISQYDRPTAVSLLKRLGLDPNFISVLSLSNQEFAELANNLRLTQDQIERTDELGRKIESITNSLRHFKDEITAQFGPTLIQAIDHIAEVFNGAIDVFNRFNQELDKMGKMKTIFVGAIAVVGILSSSFVAIGAAIWVFLEALNELSKYINGEDNVFSQLAKKFEDSKLNKFINRTAELFTPGAPGNFIATMNELNGKPRYYNSFTGQNQPPPGANNNQTINNTFNVQSSADPIDLSRQLVDTMESTLKQSNNGVVN